MHLLRRRSAGDAVNMLRATSVFLSRPHSMPEGMQARNTLDATGYWMHGLQIMHVCQHMRAQ
jgi:hypothetical protein